VVVDGDLVDVGQPPAGGGEVERDPLLLAGEADHRVEPADGRERLGADQRRAGDEAQQ
jgi:hypothetical protein